MSSTIQGALETMSAARAEIDRLRSLNAELVAALFDLRMFADVRSLDDSKTAARVNRGALRTIRDKCEEALAKAQGD